MLPRNFRKLSLEGRIAVLKEACGYSAEMPPLLDADVMVESAIGYRALPLGVAPRVLVNGRWYAVPMATEEPSVVAAQQFAAAIIGRHNGVASVAGAAQGIGQVFVRRCGRTLYRQIEAARPRLMEILQTECTSLDGRGGGVRGGWLQWQRIGRAERRGMAERIGQAARIGQAERRVALFSFAVDTVDAMGANRIIRAAEEVARWLRNNLQCDILMAILSNDLTHAPSKAQFRIPISALRLTSGDRRPASPPPESLHIAQRIALASAVADANRGRAVTHNKGIMNGISALAAATGNDTRAVEAAAHAYAMREGRYRALSRYTLRKGELHGELAVPLPLATVGGATHAQRDAKQALALLGISRAAELKEVAAAVGLQQNFAALLALTGVGIAHGHMPLHRRRMEMDAASPHNDDASAATEPWRG